MKGKWEVVSSEYVIDNHPYNMTRHDRCRLPNGIEIDSFIQEYPNWVNAIVLTPKRELVLVNQYRHGIGDFTIETPGGMIEADEDPATAIVREVAEETGYQTTEAPIFLGSFFPNPATSNNKVTTYLLLNATQMVEQNLDSTEDIDVRLIPFETFGEMITRGEAKQMFSAMGYFLAKDYLDTPAPEQVVKWNSF